MKKSIIISIQPQWVEKILNGEKTIEIRKSIPKCEFPIDVYIYCTYGVGLDLSNKKCWLLPFDKVTSKSNLLYRANSKIIAKFTLNKVDKINNCGSCFEIANESYAYANAIGNRSCLDFNDMKKYLNDKNGYAWHIDNLEILDEPMDLKDFYINDFERKFEYFDCGFQECGNAIENSILGDDGFCYPHNCPKMRVNKAPQSWCYAYKEEK